VSGREICGGKGILEGGWTYTEAPPYCKPTGFKAHTHKMCIPLSFPLSVLYQTLSNLEIINESYC